MNECCVVTTGHFKIIAIIKNNDCLISKSYTAMQLHINYANQ